jgi:hypothetical protein
MTQFHAWQHSDKNNGLTLRNISKNNVLRKLLIHYIHHKTRKSESIWGVLNYTKRIGVLLEVIIRDHIVLICLKQYFFVSRWLIWDDMQAHYFIKHTYMYSILARHKFISGCDKNLIILIAFVGWTFASFPAYEQTTGTLSHRIAFNYHHLVWGN